MKKILKNHKLGTIAIVAMIAISAVPLASALGPGATPPGGSVDANFNTVSTGGFDVGSDVGSYGVTEVSGGFKNTSSSGVGVVGISPLAGVAGLGTGTGIGGAFLDSSGQNTVMLGTPARALEVQGDVSVTGKISDTRTIDLNPGSADIMTTPAEETSCRDRGGSVVPAEGGVSLCLYPTKLSDDEGVVFGNEGLFLLPPGLFGSGPILFNNSTEALGITQAKGVTAKGISVNGPIALNGNITNSSTTTKLTGSNYYLLGDDFQVDWAGRMSNPNPAQGITFQDPDGVRFSGTNIQTDGNINITQTIPTPSTGHQPLYVRLSGGQGGSNNTAAYILADGDSANVGLEVQGAGYAVKATGDSTGSYPNSVAVDAYAHGNEAQLASSKGAVEIKNGDFVAPGLKVTQYGDISNPGTGALYNDGRIAFTDADGYDFQDGTGSYTYLRIGSTGDVSNPHSTDPVNVSDPQGFKVQSGTWNMNTTADIQGRIANTSGTIYSGVVAVDDPDGFGVYNNTYPGYTANPRFQVKANGYISSPSGDCADPPTCSFFTSIPLKVADNEGLAIADDSGAVALQIAANGDISNVSTTPAPFPRPPIDNPVNITDNVNVTGYVSADGNVLGKDVSAGSNVITDHIEPHNTFGTVPVTFDFGGINVTKTYGGAVKASISPDGVITGDTLNISHIPALTLYWSSSYAANCASDSYVSSFSCTTGNSAPTNPHNHTVSCTPVYRYYCVGPR